MVTNKLDISSVMVGSAYFFADFKISYTKRDSKTVLSVLVSRGCERLGDSCYSFRLSVGMFDGQGGWQCRGSKWFVISNHATWRLIYRPVVKLLMKLQCSCTLDIWIRGVSGAYIPQPKLSFHAKNKAGRLSRPGGLTKGPPDSLLQRLAVRVS